MTENKNAQGASCDINVQNEKIRLTTTVACAG